MKNLIGILICFFVIVKFANAQDGQIMNGRASFYADKLQGKRTSSGEPYVREGYTASHRALPFGTLLEVTNKANGLSVVVRVNDRGPVDKKLTIDLSYAAANDIGMIGSGIANVKIKIMTLGDNATQPYQEVSENVTVSYPSTNYPVTNPPKNNYPAVITTYPATNYPSTPSVSTSTPTSRNEGSIPQFPQYERLKVDTVNGKPIVRDTKKVPVIVEKKPVAEEKKYKYVVVVRDKDGKIRLDSSDVRPHATVIKK
jgi:rare lipoprotein A